MKLITAAVLVAGLSHCAPASADCFIRSSINLTRQSIDAGPTDFQQLATPDPKGFKCSVRYRVHIGNDWQTAEGTAVAPTESEACVRATDVGRGRLLLEAEPSQVRSDTQLVCSDQPEIRVRRVHIGERIWESETDLHTIPAERKYFTYKGTQCRTFVERDAKDQNMYLYQGIMCKEDSRPNTKWLVLDKY